MDTEANFAREFQAPIDAGRKADASDRERRIMRKQLLCVVRRHALNAERGC